MERETKKITTPSGTIVEFYTYLTGKEARQLQSVFLKHSKFQTGEGDKTKVVDFDPMAVPEAEELALRLVVVSVDSTPDNAADRVENLRQADYRVVIKAINEVTKDAFDPNDFLAK
jgi:hypothetical protein